MSNTDPNINDNSNQEESKNITNIVLLFSAVGILLMIGVFIWLILNNQFQKIIGREAGIIFFILLIPFALFSSSFLFSLIRKSYASMTGSHGPLQVELGGPAALFVIVFLTGLYFKNNFSEPRSRLLISFWENSEKHYSNIQGSARVRVVDAEFDHTYPLIEDNTIEITIQNSLLGKTVEIYPNFRGFLTDAIESTIPSDKNTIDIFLSKRSNIHEVSGRILDEENRVVQGDTVVIQWGSNSDTTINGTYQLLMNYDQTDHPFAVFINGKRIIKMTQSLPSDIPFDIVLPLYEK